MAIGKNAIKRVENNGYSKVATAAPDMENSSVIAAPDAQVTEKLVAPIEKATAKKTPPKKSCVKKTKKDGFVRFGFGEDLPYYLL